MRMRTPIVLLFLLFVVAAAGFAQTPDPLSRRADLGAAIRPPSGATPARVVRVSEGSALARAGLRANDDLTAIDGRSLSDPIEFDRRMSALRGGQQVRLDITRNGERHTISATLAPLPREQHGGTETLYSHIVNPAGPRQRAILTRPAGATTRLPAILFVPWLSCDSVEVPGQPSPGIDELLVRLAASSGWVMLRVDKPGVGDSEGTCADTDLETEIAGSRAGLAMLRAHPWVDPQRIVIMGQSFSGAFLPIVAGDTPVAGYIFINSWMRTWMERLIEFERLQLEVSGMRAADVSSRIRQLGEFYALFLEQRSTPAAIIKERPGLAAVWSDEPMHQYGRSAAFHHQLQAINPAAAWEKVNVPTLVMWSDADLVMHRQDHERLAAVINANKAGAATFVTVPGANHGLAARGADGGPVLPPIAPQSILEFLKRF